MLWGSISVVASIPTKSSIKINQWSIGIPSSWTNPKHTCGYTFGYGGFLKWRFPEMGVPLNHPFFLGMFHEINHPAMGLPPFMETPLQSTTNRTKLPGTTPPPPPYPSASPAHAKARQRAPTRHWRLLFWRLGEGEPSWMCISDGKWL
jgi:hypothetical protein